MKYISAVTVRIMCYGLHRNYKCNVIVLTMFYDATYALEYRKAVGFVLL